MTKIDVLNHIHAILESKCDDVAEELVKEGRVLSEIGNALKGLSVEDARATLSAVTHLERVSNPEVKR